MPKYRFKCKECGFENTVYARVDTTLIPCTNCYKDSAYRQLPNIAGQQVSEVVDRLTNVSWKQDQKELLKKRRDDHYWEVDVPRLIQTYSLETCLEQGWLVYNDKGELVINKPPSKR